MADSSQSAEEEAKILREELTAVTTRFSEWKAKAKAGVEKQKLQMLKLVDENEGLLKRNEELESIVAGLESSVVSIDTSDIDLKLDAERTLLRAENQRKIDKLREAFNSELEAVDAENKASIATALSGQRLELQRTFGRESSLDTSSIAAYAQRVTSRLLISASEVDQALQHKALLLNTSLEIWRASEVKQLQEKLKEATATYDRYRKKVDMTVKLATKDQENVKAELERMQSALGDKEREVGEGKQAIRQRDIAIEALESRVEELANMVDQYEDRFQGIDDKAKQLQNLQTEMQSMEREFNIRNDSMVELHREEKAALIERYEEEIATLSKDHEQELSLALSRANNYGTGGSGGGKKPSSSYESDDAYINLVRENEQIKMSLRALEDTNNVNAVTIRELKAKLSRFDVPTSSRGGEATRHMDTSGMEPQIMRRQIYDLEEQLLSISEQLWRANQQMHDMKADAAKKPTKEKSATNEDASGNFQQNAYMKAILVKLLCSQNTEVKSSLMPVLATLFKMNSEELRAVYTANPSWVK